jgi:hypothetical protein
MFGLMLAMGWQEIQIQSAQRQAAQATAELQAKKQVIKAFCEVAK